MPRKPTRTITLRAFKSRFDTDKKCRAFLEHVIWGDTPACRHCSSIKVWRIKGKSARPGLFQCGEKRPCGKQFTVTVGTTTAATCR
jgi:hypothetical protein